VFNVAGQGVLTVSQAAHRAGRPTIPIPFPATEVASRVIRRVGWVDFSPEQLDFLTHGRVVDTTRMHTSFGMQPYFTTPAAFDDFVRGRRLTGVLSPERVDGALEHLRSALTGAYRASAGWRVR
jgi:UDP-glucose 4-epimerase